VGHIGSDCDSLRCSAGSRCQSRRASRAQRFSQFCGPGNTRQGRRRAGKGAARCKVRPKAKTSVTPIAGPNSRQKRRHPPTWKLQGKASPVGEDSYCGQCASGSNVAALNGARSGRLHGDLDGALSAPFGAGSQAWKGSGCKAQAKASRRQGASRSSVPVHGERHIPASFSSTQPRNAKGFPKGDPFFHVRRGHKSAATDQGLCPLRLRPGGR